MICFPSLPYLNGWFGENIILAVFFAFFNWNPFSIDTICFFFSMLRPRWNRKFLWQADLIFWLWWWCWFYAGSLKEIKLEKIKNWKHRILTTSLWETIYCIHLVLSFHKTVILLTNIKLKAFVTNNFSTALKTYKWTTNCNMRRWNS